MSKMTPQQQTAFNEMCKMLESIFSNSDELAIKGALRIAMKQWETKTGHTVTEAEKWPFEKYQSECNEPVLRNFVARLVGQGYDKNLAEKQLGNLLAIVKEKYGKQ